MGRHPRRARADARDLHRPLRVQRPLRRLLSPPGTNALVDAGARDARRARARRPRSTTIDEVTKAGPDARARARARAARREVASARPQRDRLAGAGHPRRCSTSCPPRPPTTGRSIATRLDGAPGAIDGYVETLREGIAQGVVPARRQVHEVVDADRPLHQPTTDSSRRSPPRPLPTEGQLPASLARELADNANAARVAYDELAQFLSDELAPAATREGCRRPRAVRAAVAPLPRRHDRPRRDVRVGRRGARAHGRRAGVASRTRSRPAPSVEEAVAFLEQDPTRKLARHGRAAAMDAGDQRPRGRRARRDPLRHPRADPHARVHDRAHARRAGSTTPARPTTSRVPAACGGRCPRASTSSTPGAS